MATPQSANVVRSLLAKDNSYSNFTAWYFSTYSQNLTILYSRPFPSLLLRRKSFWPSRAFRTVHTATGRHMVSPVIGEGSFPVSTPRGCTAVMSIFQTNDMIYVYGGAGLVGIEAYRCVWLIALEVEVITVIAILSQSTHSHK